MLHFMSKGIAIAATASLAVLSQPTAAKAASLKLCASSFSNVVCLDTSGKHALVQPKTTDKVQLVQGSVTLISGNYFGTFRDGTNMIERIVVGNGTLTMQRLAGGHGSRAAGPAVTFFRTGANEYANRNGSKLFIASPTTFTWRNESNGNHVIYQYMH